MIPTLQLGGFGRARAIRGLPIGVAARVSSSVAQTLTQATLTAATHDTEESDTGEFWASSPNSERLTVPASGYYFAAGSGSFSSYTSDQSLEARILLDGAEAYAKLRRRGRTSYPDPLSASFLGYVAASSYVDLRFTHNHPSTTLDLRAGETQFGIVRVNTTPFGAMVRRAAAQSFGNSTNTAFSFDTETRDDGGFYDAGSPTRLTVPSGGAGWYVIQGMADWAANTNGGRRLSIRVNGSSVVGRQSALTTTTGNAWNNCSVAYPLADGDYVELMGDQNRGGALNGTGALSLARFASALGARVTRTTSQTGITSATAISFDTEPRDDLGFYSAGAPTRFTVPSGGAGVYAITGFVHSIAASGNSRILSIRKNGSTYLAQSGTPAYAAMNDPMLNVCAIARLEDADYVELVLESAASSGANAYPLFSIVRVG